MPPRPQPKGHDMTRRVEGGMATAEYAIGTVGAALIGIVLYKFAQLGVDAPWAVELAKKVRHALSWRNILDGVPGRGLWP